MSYNRRGFLKAGGMFASGVLLSSSAVNALARHSNADALPAEYGKLKEFALQLYSVRDDIPKDPKGVLQKIASYGYKQVESFEGSKGMFWGMTNTEFKKYLDGLGMKIISSHCDINHDFEKKASEAAEIGMKYLICPYIGPQKTVDDYKKYAEKFSASGAICKKNGIRFAYHNHGYSFTKFQGIYPQDIMMQNSDPSTVDFQMDMYCVITPGADPIEWLNKYPNRFRLGHVKDREKNAVPGNPDASCDLGTGSIDYGKILKVAAAKGMQYFIVEQEKYTNTTPLKSAEVDAAYMKTLTI